MRRAVRGSAALEFTAQCHGCVCHRMEHAAEQVACSSAGHTLADLLLVCGARHAQNVVERPSLRELFHRRALWLVRDVKARVGHGRASGRRASARRSCVPREREVGGRLLFICTSWSYAQTRPTSGSGRFRNVEERRSGAVSCFKGHLLFSRLFRCKLQRLPAQLCCPCGRVTCHVGADCGVRVDWATQL